MGGHGESPGARLRKAPLQFVGEQQIARILTRAVHGFKESATSLEDLRTMIDGLLTMTLAALNA